MKSQRPLTLTAISLLASITLAYYAAANDRPNVVVILADDLGWNDVGFHGSDIRTPSIDSIAIGGAKLERFYALPMCTPTRAALLTGRYPFRYGLQTAAIPSDAEYGLDLGEFLLPQMLKRAGYATAIVGKWHLGHASQNYWPKNRGFDTQYGPLVGEIDYYTHVADGKVDWYRDHAIVKEVGYATELIGKEAEQVVLKHDVESPLFLYLAFTAPHAPYQAPSDYEKRYSHIQDPTRRTYAGMITCMDDQIGKVVAALKKRRMWQNTVVLFMSDNGGNRLSMFSGEGDVSNLVLPASNKPYRGGKGTLLEGGCRVVAAVSWPLRIKPCVISEPMHVVDLLPTIVGLAEANTTGSKSIDGVDQMQLLIESGKSARAEVVYNVEPYRAAISQDNWKLILRVAMPPSIELYDLDVDATETTNLADHRPQLVADLRKRLAIHAKGAARPLFLRYMFEHSESMRGFLQSLSPDQPDSK